MAEQLVATVRTPIAPQALYATLRGAWRSLIGSEPTREQLLVLMSQWALETNAGAASNNWNLAGIKHVPGDGHDYARYETTEVVDGKPVKEEQDFRAYPSLEDASTDYLYELHARFAWAWPAVLEGDVQDFAARLKARGYYTASLQAYKAGLLVRRHWLDKVLGPDTQPELATTADEVLAVATGVGNEPVVHADGAVVEGTVEETAGLPGPAECLEAQGLEPLLVAPPEKGKS